MYRDILVVLGAKDVAAPYALSFARLFEAEVTAVWPSRESDLDAAAATRKLLEFVERAAELRVRARMIPPSDFEHGDPRKLPLFARGFDLVVVEQPTPEQPAFAGGLIGSIVSESGRPVLATPYIQKDPASFERVLVAWDASAAAARALGGAMPILARATSVEIVTVMNDRADKYVPGGPEVVRHLAAHGIDATFRELPGGIDAAEMLLSYVADTGAGMMVTGAYGHSHLAETILGGATRTFLDSMTICLFMAH